MTDYGSTGGAIASAESMLRMMERDLKIAPEVIAKNLPFSTFPEFVQYNTVRSAAVAKRWRKEGRQTLAMHPTVVEETRLASSDKVPCEILRALPYLNPMVVYADPPRVPSWTKLTGSKAFNNRLYRTEEEAMRLIGFMTYSFSSRPRLSTDEKLVMDWHQMVASTHDPDSEYFGIMVFLEVIDAHGNVIDTEVNSFSMLFSETMTLAELVEDQAGRFAFNTGAGDIKDDENAKKWIREVLKIIVGTLFYLCSTTLDAERVPAKATRHLAHTIARKPLSLYRVGWTLGAALTRYRRERDRVNPSQMGDIRHQQDPQHRRAHFKVVWTGRGRSIPKTAYVAPYWTKRELLGEFGINTLRKVPKVG